MLTTAVNGSFKPVYYYWIIFIIARKFLIAYVRAATRVKSLPPAHTTESPSLHTRRFTSLMFRSNPSFQMAVALLVMFSAYALQVKHNPYMSMVEMEAVIADHKVRAEKEDDAVHSAIATTIRENTKEKRKLRRNRMGSGKDRETKARIVGGARATRQYFFNYNTVESVLLGCGVFVNLAGIMFESGQCVVARARPNVAAGVVC